MNACVFQTSEVKRCVTHALASAEWTMPYSSEPPRPALAFVHDDGVYVTSNGIPRDVLPDADRCYSAYAEGCDRTKNDDWWETSRDLVGGDDFVELLTIDSRFVELCDTYEQLLVTVTATSLKVEFANPRKAGAA